MTNSLRIWRAGAAGGEGESRIILDIIRMSLYGLSKDRMKSGGDERSEGVCEYIGRARRETKKIGGGSAVTH